MNLKNYNWPLILLVAALLSLAGCKSDSMVVPDNSVGGDSQVFDADGDGIPDNEDSCPNTRNSGVDADADGIDDACDSDIAPSTDVDNDGVPNGEDNCPTVVNPDQLNADRDLYGDACDTDADGDGVADKTDNGDGTYTDIEVVDGGDNCPLVVNPDQANLDQDEFGDACDNDIDGDGFLNGEDACPYVVGNDPSLCGETVDTDGDGIPDVYPSVEPYLTDGVAGENWDNCVDVPNPDQADLDGDGEGDACETDTDGDGVNDLNLLDQPLDNCPLVPNGVNEADVPGVGNQTDSDNDGIGDACDLINDVEFACGVDQQFTPMLSSDADIKAVASKDTSECLTGLLAGVCNVENLGAVIDNDLDNAAIIKNTNLLGLSEVTLRIAATSGFAYPGQNVIGVSIAESAQLLQLDLLSNGGLQVRTLLNNEIQEQTNGEVGADLDLLGLSGMLGGTERGFLVFQTSKPFDSVEITSGGFELLTLLDEYNVYAVCASKEEVPQP